MYLYNPIWTVLAHPINNTANNCHLNALLQCLLSLSQFNEAMVAGHDIVSKKYCNYLRRNTSNGQEMLDLIYSELKKQNKHPLFTIKNQPKDAMETFLMFLECIPQKLTDSLFSHVYAKHVYCGHCGNKAILSTKESNPFFHVTNALVANQVGLSRYIVEHQLEHDNNYSCSICSNKDKQVHIARLEKLPPLLILVTNGSVLTTKVTVPDFLHFDLFNDKYKYKCVAQLFYCNGPISGHYYSVCLRRGIWVQCNDSAISKLSKKKICNNAYATFYSLVRVKNGIK